MDGILNKHLNPITIGVNMNSKGFALVLGAIFITALLFSACNKSDPTSPLSLKKSAVVMLKANGKTNNGKITTSNGNITLSAFNINLSKINIQENSGFDGEQQGENKNGGSESNGSETETPDLTLNGPFNFDVATGSVTIGNFDVYPGTFKQVDLYFLTENNPLFNGNSIVINGNFTNENGTEIPFALKSKFSKSFQTFIAGNGITVNQNSTVPITITFDFNKIFANMSFNGASITNGTILIDETNNYTLLQTFENNLNNSVELESE